MNKVNRMVRAVYGIILACTSLSELWITRCCPSRTFNDGLCASSYHCIILFWLAGLGRRGHPLIQGWLKTWIWQLWQKFVTFIPLWILVNDTNIICLPTKNMQFCKIKRLWLKNWACHAHLRFKIQKGVASSFFQPHPPNFGKICILYRWKNDIITIFK